MEFSDNEKCLYLFTYTQNYCLQSFIVLIASKAAAVCYLSNHVTEITVEISSAAMYLFTYSHVQQIFSVTSSGLEPVSFYVRQTNIN